MIIIIIMQDRMAWCSGKAPRLAFEMCSVRVLAGTPAFLTEVRSGFPQSLRTNAGIVRRFGQDNLFQDPF
jgi:hypothetical protein